MDQETLDAMATDTQYQKHVIETVTPVDGSEGFEGWMVGFDGGLCLFVPGKGAPIAPKVGETMQVYGMGFVRGIMVGGRVYTYQTEGQMRAEAAARQMADDAKRRAAFEEGRDLFTARVAALPPAFRERMRGFLATSADWGWEMGGYELFVCEEAAKILAVISTAEGIKSFHAASMETQKDLVPGLDYDNHSGNTFGCAVRLAYLACTDTDLVPKMHAAMCPLMGCAAAGCWNQRPGTLAERQAQ